MRLKLPKSTFLFRSLVSIILIGLIAGGGYLTYDYIQTKKEIEDTQSKIGLFEENLDETLFKEHLKLTQSFAQSETILQLEQQLGELTTQMESQEFSLVPTIYEQYALYIEKVQRHDQNNLDANNEKSAADAWSQMLLDQKFEELLVDINAQITSLDDEFQEYLASLPPPPTPPSADPASAPSGGYSYQSVSNERGTFGVYLIKENLSSVRVITAAASSDDCKDNCPVKSLEQHVKDNGGFAGINGTYFCPPDYGECSGKINSFDFALYKSSSGKWLNKNALGWSDTGLMTFKGSDADFYRKSTDYGGGSVTAGISNYPSLLRDREIVVDPGKLTSYQRDVKGARGAIGVGDQNLYLAIITNATVVDAAYVMRDLGAKHALNLDGGGSSALYANGGYVIGPGRNLPNAVVLVK